MRKTVTNIKKYWDEKADQYFLKPAATTGEYKLRELEGREIRRAIEKIQKKKTILDVGCGDGYTTIQIAKAFPRSKILGIDYSERMIRNAREFLKKSHIISGNIAFRVHDMLQLNALKEKFDIIVTDRCLINLPTRKEQKKAIAEIWNVLAPGGHYIMVENFVEGHNKMNALRRRVGLKPIPVRWHNLFLKKKFIEDVLSQKFYVVEEKNISSLFHLLTKVVYSKLCQIGGVEPSYDHPIYDIAIALDEAAGDFGQLYLLILKKR